MQKFEVTAVTPRGYCQGVVRAIRIARETAAAYPDTPVHMLGMIVHNAHVVAACRELGISCLEDPARTRLELLEDISSGVVIFTAHGVSDAVYARAEEKGLIVVDATCPDVRKTHDLVREHCTHGDVIYIGKHRHPEAEGVAGISPRVHLIATAEEIDALPELHDILITNQTTLSILDTALLAERAVQRFPDAVMAPEICNATTIRQKAILALKDTDVLIVVGDPHSNNSNQLRELGKKAGIGTAYLIEDCSQLRPEMFADCRHVAVTSGSSTPTGLTSQVIEVIRSYAETGIWNPPAQVSAAVL